MKKVFQLVVVAGILSAFGGTLYYLWAKSQVPPEAFETRTPAIATIVKKTVATGALVPRREVEIKPQISGILEEVLVEPGAVVKAGDLVARVRVVPDMVRLNEAQSRVNMARIRRENAERDLARGKDLGAKGTISAAELQQYEKEAAQAVEEQETALSNLDIIKEGVTKKSGSASNTMVRATIAGTILEVPLEAGASVIESNTFNAGTTIATIADLDDMIFEGKVDESEVGKLREGMELVITIGALPGDPLKATLEHIAPKGAKEEGAVQFQIRAALQLPEGRTVRANLSANADIVLDRRDGVLAIDEALLQFEKEKPYVEVEVGPQRFERREIQVGLSDGITIEVLSGLTKDDKVKVPAAKKAA